MKDKLVNVDNNCYPFINNVNYIWAKYLQASKILKGLMNIFFSNSDLAPMQE